MQCQNCEKPATFHITDMVDGDPKELHLCEDCAQSFLSPSSQAGDDAMPAMAGLLAQQLAVGETAEELARLDQNSCPVCGNTFLEFRKQGRLGCPHDYVCFETELEPLLLNIHGETRHVGKVPKHCSSDAEQQTQLIRLRREMKAAVTKEDYEQASKIRDEIRAIETQQNEAQQNKSEPDDTVEE